VAGAAREADLFLLNLECCISEAGGVVAGRRQALLPGAAAAVDALVHLGADCVTLVPLRFGT